jgi:hypothetical protein
VNPLFPEVCPSLAGPVTLVSELIFFFMTYCLDFTQVSKSVSGLARRARSSSDISGS